MELTARDALLDHPRVKPEARSQFRKLVRAVRAAGLPLLVWETWRSPERQRLLYAQGRSDDALRRAGFDPEERKQARLAGFTADKPRVTRRLVPGPHSDGRAMDCCWLKDGRPSWNAPEEWWQRYGAEARALRLVWGGDWKMRDCPHVQRP